MLKRNGGEAYCIRCAKWRPIEGREKEANSHQHWCAECIQAQREQAEMPALLRVQAS